MDPDARNGWQLAQHEGAVELRAPGDAPGRGLRADWSQLRLPDGASALRGQPLGRAVGSAAHTAIDATAGLGFDTFAMAAMGLQVRAIERNDWVLALLQQAHAWALADAKLKPIFDGKAAVSMFEMNKHLAKHLK